MAKLYTSGTTGTRKPVSKTLKQLQEEIFTLEERWSEQLGDATIYSTVSPQHIYGLLFRILWPLSAGRTFDDRTLLYPADLVDYIRDQTSGPVALVSTPAHLKRFVKYEHASDLAERVCVVFSSGGRLSEEIAERVREQLGTYPYEVLGSTETGGVAWRTQEDRKALWKPFDPVEVRDSGTLEVRSPFVSTGHETGWESMGDQVEILEDGFRLGPRSDRVVNIAEKRLSLPELEEKLEGLEDVQHAAALALEEPSETANRKVLSAAVVLSEQGKQVKSDGGVQDLKQLLRKKLRQSMDPVTIPRRWRFVQELPRTAQGKVPRDQLEQLLTKQKASD